MQGGQIIGHSGEHNDRDVWILSMRAFKGLQSLAVWQAEIEQQDIETLPGEFFQTMLEQFGYGDVEISQRVAVQGFFQEQHIGGVILDQ